MIRALIGCSPQLGLPWKFGSAAGKLVPVNAGVRVNFIWATTLW